MNRTVRLLELLDALDRTGSGPDVGVCVDADGTLWSGDVGEDFFEFAIEHRLLRSEAVPVLNRMAVEAKVEQHSEPNQQARLLLDGYRSGRVAETVACEMMAVGFAGWKLDELLPIVATALDRARLESRLYTPLEPVFAWLQRTDTQLYVVSASPSFVLHVAARSWGIEPAQIVGCTPRQAHYHLQDQLEFPLPYGEEKVTAGRDLLNERRWLASFGDNVFDIPMLLEAEIGLAVRPKPALREYLNQLTKVWLLDDARP